MKTMKDEALKLALEALEDAVLDYSMGKSAVARHTKAIAAIKQAFAAPVQEPVAWMYEDMMGLVGVCVQKEKPIVARPVTPLYTTPPAQPAPVQSCFCPNCEAMGKELAALKAQPHATDLTHDQWDEWQDKYGLILERDALDDLRAMLAAQRQWVGLTDEEISDIAINNPPMVHEFARAIEANLKGKNT